MGKILFLEDGTQKQVIVPPIFEDSLSQYTFFLPIEESPNSITVFMTKNGRAIESIKA